MGEENPVFSLSIVTQDPIKNVPTLPSSQHGLYVKNFDNEGTITGNPTSINDLTIVLSDGIEFNTSTDISGFSYENNNMGYFVPVNGETIITPTQGIELLNIKYVSAYFGYNNVTTDTQDLSINMQISNEGAPVNAVQNYNISENGWTVSATTDNNDIVISVAENTTHNLWILADFSATPINFTNISEPEQSTNGITFSGINSGALRSAPQMFIVSTESIPINCLGANTPIVVSLDGKTANIADLSKTTVVVRDKTGMRRLVEGKVYRTVMPSQHDSIAIDTSFGVLESAATHLFFSQDPSFTDASINNSKCKRQCKKNSHDRCARCMPFSVKDYDSFVAVDMVEAGLARSTKKSDFLYHIILDKKYKNWAMEIGDGSILSESFRHQYGDRESDQYWTEN